MSKISIVVPVYNAGKYLDKCIKSILNQTFKDIELVLINDGSTDNSLEICEKYQKKDQRILLINKENEGTVPTRKKGIESSNSAFITFVDADDWIDKNAIKIMYQEIIRHDLDIVVCNTYRILGSGRFIKAKNKSWYFDEEKIYNKNEIKKDLAVAYLHGHPFPVSLHGKVYKKDLLLNSGNFLDRIHFLGDDLFYNLEILLKTNKLKVIDKPLYYYRLGGFTSKYMPYFFSDAINGYEIQKDVINLHYKDTKQNEYNGISIMLLNMLKSSVYNLFNSKIQDIDIKRHIDSYLINESILESVTNEGVVEYFSKGFLDAINNKDVEYFYQMGYKWNKKRKTKQFLMKAINRVSII